MKALFSEPLGTWPAGDLNQDPEGRLNIFKGWEHKVSGELWGAAVLSNCILTLWVKKGSDHWRLVLSRAPGFKVVSSFFQTSGLELRVIRQRSWSAACS